MCDYNAGPGKLTCSCSMEGVSRNQTTNAAGFTCDACRAFMETVCITVPPPAQPVLP